MDLTPQAVVNWTDKETGAQGFLVFDRLINGIAGGGIFMHSEATMKETADIARNMTKKFTVTFPQIGGAKAGIRFDHSDPRAKDVLERFLKDNARFLETMWVTAGDLNTDDAFIESVIVDQLKLSCCQHALAEKVSAERNQENLALQLKLLIDTPANRFSKLIEATVGYGLSQAVKFLTEKITPKKQGKLKVVIQGFGAVGSSLAYYITSRGIGDVIAISDKDGFIYSPEGLPIVEILESRLSHIQNLEHNSVHLLEYSKNCTINLSDEQKKRFNFVVKQPNWSDIDYFKRFLSCVQADVFCPCATRYCITKEVVECLANSTFKNVTSPLIVSGANNPYGVLLNGKLVEDKDNFVTSLLQSRGIIIAPDWVCNSGTAQLFHRGLSIKFDLKDKDLSQRVLDACASPIQVFLEEALRIASDPTELSSCCISQAERKIKNPLPLVFDEDALRFPNPARSIYSLGPKCDIPDFTDRLKEVMSVGVECTEHHEMVELLKQSNNPVCYDGFEPSGRMHIAQGLMKALAVNKLTKAGFTYIIWVADIFAKLNHKMGGDMQKIHDVGRYFIEIWKACGMDTSRVKFIWASEEISKRSDEYWSLVTQINEIVTINRVKRCLQIQGRSEDRFEEQTASAMLYSTMQCADIFFLGVDVCQLGMDQRKVNMLARDVAPKLRGCKQPIILSHPMLSGLVKGGKMSKSDPQSAIYMEDTPDEVSIKIKKAYCPPGDADDVNPCLEYFRLIIFPWYDDIIIKREKKDGGDKTYHTFEELKYDYKFSAIHALDLKSNLVRYLNQLLDPIRSHFETNPEAKELLTRIRSYNVSRVH